MNLDRFPRVDLGGHPTPLHPAPRLGEALGLPNLLLKRDDVHPLGVGGNKLRKLEFLLGAAIEAGVDTVITFGALQTNHGRQTAAACAKLGLRCELVLTAKVPRDGDAYERSGNVLLDHLFGANVHVCRDGEETGGTYDRLITEAAAEGRKVATFPVGGSDAVGALGYVAAAHEIAGQLADRGITKARLVVPHASGGTSAGLLAGTAKLDWLTLDVACVSHPVDEALDNLADLTTAVSVLLGIEPPSLEGLRIDDRAIGPGYGLPTPGTWDAVRLFGRTEGIALDPVYTGKVAAMLVDWAAEGHFAAEEHVVFLHTGGLPGLYGYAPEFTGTVGG
ncbi:1-aminocyclopropane-1-carboxylate deaminase [Amycolatopsis coloradensis]|uniref:1-aminocyclopropane-1-carboxylate deaminase n=1 Tax=Amycolatopsis coloradensis TaxID=76021 RepID=A0A1R0KM20_9PSEU|nr:D-cysteine desulfhydrase family protein [Amycolatopsis coloradensis]OLZ47716.1 1-aminocyclopropane-1-carboxylate deaminase [Amycolatopsis coloradensis]